MSSAEPSMFERTIGGRWSSWSSSCDSSVAPRKTVTIRTTLVTGGASSVAETQIMPTIGMTARTHGIARHIALRAAVVLS
jgi:hypothetical protein